MKPAHLVHGTLALSQLAGCVQHKAELARAMEGARDVVAVAAPCLASVKAAELEACASRPEAEACVVEARARWAKLADALDAFHAAWCLLSPESEGCES